MFSKKNKLLAVGITAGILILNENVRNKTKGLMYGFADEVLGFIMLGSKGQILDDDFEEFNEISRMYEESRQSA